MSFCSSGEGGGRRTHVFLASVVFPLATHPFRDDEAPFHSVRRHRAPFSSWPILNFTPTRYLFYWFARPPSCVASTDLTFTYKVRVPTRIQHPCLCSSPPSGQIRFTTRALLPKLQHSIQEHAVPHNTLLLCTILATQYTAQCCLVRQPNAARGLTWPSSNPSSARQPSTARRSSTGLRSELRPFRRLSTWKPNRKSQRKYVRIKRSYSVPLPFPYSRFPLDCGVRVVSRARPRKPYVQASTYLVPFHYFRRERVR